MPFIWHFLLKVSSDYGQIFFQKQTRREKVPGARPFIRAKYFIKQAASWSFNWPAGIQIQSAKRDSPDLSQVRVPRLCQARRKLCVSRCIPSVLARRDPSSALF